MPLEEVVHAKHQTETQRCNTGATWTLFKEELKRGWANTPHKAALPPETRFKVQLQTEIQQSRKSVFLGPILNLSQLCQDTLNLQVLSH